MLRNPGLRKSVEQPVLDLNFAAAQIGSNAAPDSRIDFSRGTNAWFVDSDGLVKRSPHNLLQQSQTFDTTWSQTGCSVTANSVNAPDATLTGYKLIKNAAFGFASLSQNVSLTVTAGRATATLYAKADERDKIALREGVVTGGYAAFDLTNGTILDETNVNEASITSVGDGWFRILIDVTLSSGTSFGVRIVPLPDSYTSGSVTASFSDDGTSGVYIWGSQTSEHSYDLLPVDNPYLKTTSSAVYAARLDHDPAWFMSAAQEQNLLQYSEILDDSYWTKTRTTVTANALEAPDGTVTAELLSEDTSSNNTHILRQSTPADVPQTAGKSYVFSGYLKAGGRHRARIRFESSAHQAHINLIDGTINNLGMDSVSLTDEGNGWFRFAGVQTADATNDPLIQVMLVADDGSTNYTGDGSSGVYVWGLQLEVGTSPSTYHRTEGAPYYGPGATPKGLLIEEQRTNLITDSEDFTAASWSSSGVTVTGNDVLAPDGTITGTKLVATASNAILSDSFTKAASAKTYTATLFAKTGDEQNLQLSIDDGGSTNRGRVNFDITDGSVSSTHNDGNFTNTSGSVEDFGNGWYRLRVTTTTNTGTSLRHRFFFSDFGTDTCFVWGAQLEEASFATSYIKTAGSTATRNADVATMGPTVAPLKTTGPEIIVNGTFDTDSDWIDDDQGTGSSSISDGKLVLSGDDFANRSMRYQQVTLVDGERYRLSFDKFDDQMVVRVGTSVQGDELVSATFSSTASGGESFNYDFTANGTTAYVRFIHQNTGATPSGTSRIDNVSLKKIQDGTELVTNGTFDTDASNWFFTAATLSSESGKLRVTSTGGSYAQANQLLSTVVGRRYRLTADVDFGTSASANVQINAESDGSYTASESFTADGSASIDFTAQTTTPRVIVHIGASTSAGVYQEFDNVSVRELYPFEQFEQSQGTIVAEITHETVADASTTYYPATLVFKEGGAAANGIYFINAIGPAYSQDTTRYVYIKSDGANQVNGLGQKVDPGVPFVQALSYATNDIDQFISGDVPSGGGQSDNSCTLPHPDQIVFNNNSKGAYYIKRLTYFNRKVSDDTLQFLSDV